MFTARHPELSTLAMRPGRRNMVNLLLERGPLGADIGELSAAYYDGDDKPRAASQSVATQIQRLRSKVEPLGYTLVSVGRGGVSVARCAFLEGVRA